MRNEYARLVEIFRKQLSEDKQRDLLQAVTDSYEYGVCPLCGCEDMPVDRKGNEIKGDDVSKAFEWREVHDDDCFVTLMEKPFTVKR